MFEKFSRRARLVLSLARQEALRLGAEELGLDHLLLGLVGQDDGVAAVAFKRVDLDVSDVRKRVAARAPAPPGEADTANRPFSTDPRNLRIAALLRKALESASATGGARGVDSGHLLLAWCQSEPLARDLAGVDIDRLRSALQEVQAQPAFTPHRPRPVNCGHANLERLHDGFTLFCRECRRVWVAVHDDHPFELEEEPPEA